MALSALITRCFRDSRICQKKRDREMEPRSRTLINFNQINFNQIVAENDTSGLEIRLSTWGTSDRITGR
ncbi:hypothetical protein [Myxacorys almedinensis]|uniref:Uncharacterized protein n=1 Tax=Myxacorys almedinensis A TaxID=2690445 RepID=A0A8J7Z1K9_9CYAN|nr:hypothetical protein [Myxacorys almedinensis]NDJ17530.1 hypothetical protein [Myxacorys almedinensis A]